MQLSLTHLEHLETLGTSCIRLETVHGCQLPESWRQGMNETVVSLGLGFLEGSTLIHALHFILKVHVI